MFVVLLESHSFRRPGFNPSFSSRYLKRLTTTINSSSRGTNTPFWSTKKEFQGSQGYTEKPGQKIFHLLPGRVLHAFSPSTWGAGERQVISEFQVSQGCIVRPVSKKECIFQSDVVALYLYT